MALKVRAWPASLANRSGASARAAYEAGPGYRPLEVVDLHPDALPPRPEATETSRCRQRRTRMGVWSRTDEERVGPSRTEPRGHRKRHE